MSRASLFLFYYRGIYFSRDIHSSRLLSPRDNLPYSFLPTFFPLWSGEKNSGAISKEIVEPLETLSALSLEESLYLLFLRIFLKTESSESGSFNRGIIN